MKNILSFILLFSVIGIVYIVPDNYENSIWIGVLALILSFVTIFQVKGEPKLQVLISIIFYVNLSAYILGPLTKGLLFSTYQFDLWNSMYDTIGMKCILITALVFYLVFKHKKNKGYMQNPVLNNYLKNNYSTVSLSGQSNSLISIVCLLLVLVICTNFFNGSVSGDDYQSNSNALYEYVIFIMVLAWYYGGNNTFVKFFWMLCAAYYVLMGIMAGDRSSAFMLLTLIALYKIKNISIGKMLILCLLGIFAANTVAMFREGSLTRGMGLELYAQGLKSVFSDTAAQSYYSGLTIFYYLDKVGNGMMIFFEWVLSLFTGSLFVDRSAVELSKLAANYNPNGGGGFFQSMFFSFYGYVGVALGSGVVAYIISKIYYSWNNTFSQMLMFVIPVMSFRWYLYTPTTFFRACLLNFGIMYLATKLFNSAFHKKR